MTQVNQSDDRFLLDIDEHCAKIRHKIGQLYVRLAMLDSVEATLADCGTGGVYAEFDTPADAIVQMDNQIKELTARLATLDALVTPELAALLERLADLAPTAAPWASERFRVIYDEEAKARALAARIREALETSDGKEK